MNLIYDIKQTESFLDKIFINIDQMGIFYCSTFYRNKYCKNSNLRNASSIHLERYLLRYPTKGSSFNANKIQRHLKDVSAFTDKEGGKLNPNGIVAYINANPSNPFRAALKAIAEFMPTVKEYNDCLIKGKVDSSVINRIKKFDVEYMKGVQNERSKKNFLDIDIDANEELSAIILHQLSLAVDLTGSLKVKTHGGIHILLPISNLKELRLNIHTTLKRLENYYQSDSEEKLECGINKIGMVPIPGSIQGGHKVTFEEI